MRDRTSGFYKTRLRQASASVEENQSIHQLRKLILLGIYNRLRWNSVSPVLTLALGKIVLCIANVGSASTDSLQQTCQGSELNTACMPTGPTTNASPPRLSPRLALARVVAMVVSESNVS